jgi:hypothetical protein
MIRRPAFALALLIAMPFVPALAQPATQTQVAPTTVSRVTLYRILPGQNAAFNRDVAENLIPVWEEFKKAGMIVDYAVFSKNSTDGPDDWNIGITLTYANFAALDGFGAKAGPITLKHYGTAERRTAAGNARNQLRTVVQSFLTQRLTFTR